MGQAWWCELVIPALWRLRQEDCHMFEASLDYMAKTYEAYSSLILRSALQIYSQSSSLL